MKHRALLAVAILLLLACQSHAQSMSLFHSGKLQFGMRAHFNLEDIEGRRINQQGDMSYGTSQVDSLVADGFSVSEGTSGVSIDTGTQRIALSYQHSGNSYRLVIQLDSAHGVCDLAYSDSSGNSGPYSSYRYYVAAFRSLPFKDVDGVFTLVPLPNDTLLAHIDHLQFAAYVFVGMFSSAFHSGYQTSSTTASLQLDSVAVAGVEAGRTTNFSVWSRSNSTLFSFPASAKTETLDCFDLLGRKIFEASIPPSCSPCQLSHVFPQGGFYIARYRDHSQKFAAIR